MKKVEQMISDRFGREKESGTVRKLTGVFVLVTISSKVEEFDIYIRNPKALSSGSLLPLHLFLQRKLLISFFK